MPRQKTCRLGGDYASLDAGQHRLGVSQRQADRLQSVSAFVEVQDCVFADHIVVVTNDPELDLEAHACPKGCHCGSARLSAADIPDQTPSPTFCHAPISKSLAMIERRVALFAHLHVNKEAAPEMYRLPILTITRIGVWLT
jgi:hypothetical protein